MEHQAYELLSKLYYKTPQKYDSIYQERYSGLSAVHLDFQIGEYPAFYLILPEITRLLSEIHKIDKQNTLLCTKLPGVALSHFTRRCLVDEIVLTNTIEGVSSTRQDINSVLDDLEKSDKRNRFHGLVQKYYMIQESENVAIKTCQDVRNIYDDLVLREVKDEDENDVPDGSLFRKNAVYVHSPTQKIIHTGLYPESRIISAMEQAISYLNSEQEVLLVRIAVFHYLIGYIHPFYDGNGRLSRFISSYLISQELHPLLSYRLSYTIKENISEYYNAFKACNDPKNRGDITPFVQMFLNIILQSSSQLYTALNKRLQSLKTAEQLLDTLPPFNGRPLSSLGFLLIQAALFSEKGISISELREQECISRSTLQNRLSRFEEHGLLVTKTEKREKFYRLDIERLVSLAAQ